MMYINLSTIDWFIVVFYLIIVLLIGYWAALKTHHLDDLFLANRKLSWMPIGFSLFASNISSTTLIGLAGAAYTWGIAVANYEWMAAPILVFFAFFIAPRYLSARVSTVPEFLEIRFNRVVRRYFSLFTILANIVVDTAGTLYAGALVLTLLFPSLDLYSAALILALFSGLYTAAGGLAAVVYTDVLQAIVLIIGATILAFMSFAKLDFSWYALSAQLPPQQLTLILPLDDPNMPWLGALIGVPVLGFYFWCTNQFIVQRVLAARSIEDARQGALFAGFLKLTVLFIMVIPGAMATLIVPNLTSGDQVFPMLVSTLLPVGLSGLVIAALAAALMSSIDSTLNSAAALVTLDFIQPTWRNLSDNKITWIGRITILVFMLTSAFIAPLIGSFKGLFDYLQQVLAYSVPPISAVFLFGIFHSKTSSTAALSTLIIGHLVAILIFFASFQGVLQIHFTLVASFLFALCSLILFCFSFFAKGRYSIQLSQSAATLQTDDSGSVSQKKHQHRKLAILLILLTIWEVVIFW